MRAIATKQPTNDFTKQNKNGGRGRSRSRSPLSTGMPRLQRQCACGGGCPRCQDELGIQTKLKISEPGDKYEQEADRIADEVMRMPEPSVQRQLEPEEEEQEMVQRKEGDLVSQSDDKRGLSPILSSAPALPEFSINHFVNGNFANFDAQYDVIGPVPAIGTLFISNRVHMNYPKSMKKDEQTTFENDFVKSVHDKWSNKYLLTLNEPGFSPYQCNVDVISHIEKDPDNAHTVIDVVKPKLSEKRFRSRVSRIDKKKNSETTQKAKLDFRDPTIEEQKTINEADFIRDVGNFDFDSDRINNDCQEDIDKITDFIKQNAPQQDPNVCTFSLQYTGRASSQGDKFYNKKLSERRIKSVEKILESLPGLCLSISVAAGEEEATEDAEFRRVSVGVFLENSQKPKNATQNVAAHEFGHMIGLGDEYVETVPEIPGSRAKFFGDKPTHYDLVKSIIDDTAADELIIQDSSNIMARGNDVKRGHYVFFVAAIDIMTRPEIQKATGKPDAKWNVI
jgi:outer membrane protein OmpA-like peptidoglycan-associated protein